VSLAVQATDHIILDCNNHCSSCHCFYYTTTAAIISKITDHVAHKQVGIVSDILPLALL